MESSHDDVVRHFWAGVLESQVKSDGQVPGFSDWWNKADPWKRENGDRYAEACWAKIARDGREPTECVASGVAEFKMALRQYIPPRPKPPVDPAEVRQLVGVITRELWTR